MEYLGYDFDRDSHTGVFFYDINGKAQIAFAPKKCGDLSGWQIENQDGTILYYCDIWEDADQAQIEKDLEALEEALKELTPDSKQLTAAVRGIIDQEDANV